MTYRPRDLTALVHFLWNKRSTWILAGLLAIYGLAICLDLPWVAGKRYGQNLPASTLIRYGVSPLPFSENAAHWWLKVQGLRGWSNYPEGWSWMKIAPAPLERWLLVAGLGLLGAVGLYWLERRAARRPRATPWAALVALIAFGYGSQLATLWLKSPNVEQLLLDRVTSPDFTGYLSSATLIHDESAFFANYNRTLTSPIYCSHCKTHPPGPVLYYWYMLHDVDDLPAQWLQDFDQFVVMAAQLKGPKFSADEVVTAWLSAHGILLGAAAIVIPLYGLARRLGAQELALPLAALGVVVPGLILMSPEFDQLYGTFTAVLLYLSLRGLATPRHHGRWGFVAGLFFAFCVYWSFGLGVLVVPLGLLALAAAGGWLNQVSSIPGQPTGRLPVAAVIRWIVGFGLGSGLPWGLLWSVGRFHLLDVLHLAGRAQLLGITAVRPYEPWVVFNLVDYLQFAGLPLILATLLMLAWRRTSTPGATTLEPETNQNQAPSARMGLQLNFYGVLFWGVILLLDLSGAARGETGRLWIFLTPLALLAVFHAAGQGRLKASHIHALLAAQFVVCVLIGGNWLTP
jgi:hypothetical protein